MSLLTGCEQLQERARPRKKSNTEVQHHASPESCPDPAPTDSPTPTTETPAGKNLKTLKWEKTVFFLLVCELSCLFHKLILALFFNSLAKIAAVKHTSIGWKSSFLFLFLCLWHTQGGTSDGAELPGQTSPVCTHRNTMIISTRLEHTS